ncbi:MAG: ATP-binding protein [Pseudomonadota bacterium]
MWFRKTEAHPSLRRRLAVLVLAAVALASLAQGVSAYRGALRAADAAFDESLRQIAHSLQAATPGEATLFDYSVQIWGPDGVEIFRSRGIQPPGPAAPPSIGFSDAVIGGRRLRLYVLRTPERTVQVAQDLDARSARARDLGLRAVLPGAVLAPLLMLAAWLLVGRLLAPVERVRRQVAARATGDLSPLPARGLPAEVLPLVGELNALFGRARGLLDSQQRFVADAAHELRSPLAALKLQAQALQREFAAGRGPEAVARLEAGIERTIALAGQMLALARAEAEPDATTWNTVDLEALCREAVSDVLPAAQARGVDVGMAALEPAEVRGDAQGLRILLRNLLDNAVKYAPPGGVVDLSVVRDAQDVLLAVEDNGPGIPEGEREHAFERFHRLPGRDDAPGSGLGLAIVRAIARQHGAAVVLSRSERLGGLRAELRFRERLSEA